MTHFQNGNDENLDWPVCHRKFSLLKYWVLMFSIRHRKLYEDLITPHASDSIYYEA